MIVTETITVIATMVVIMGEDVKGNEIVTEIVTGREIEIVTGTETVTGGMKSMDGIETEKGRGTGENVRGETETVDGVGAVQGVGVEIVEKETVKMENTARGVIEGVPVQGGAMRKMVMSKKNQRRRRKRRRRRAMGLTIQIQRLPRLTGSVLLLVWHHLSYEMSVLYVVFLHTRSENI